MFSLQKFTFFLLKKEKRNTPKKEEEIIRIFILKMSNVRTKYTFTLD